MTELAVQTLSPGTARILTDEVKRDAESLWRKLVELYEGDAHSALKYPSWHAYCDAEFGMSQAHSYRLLHAGRALSVIQLDNGLPRPENEAQARELAPLLDEPDVLREAWAEVVHLHPKPTAAQVREVVARHIEPQTEAQRREAAEKQHRWAATLNVLDGLQHFDRPAIRAQAESVARLIDPDVAATRGEVITVERLRRAAAWASLLADEIERTIDA